MIKRYNKRCRVIMILAMISWMSIFGQKFAWDVDFSFIFDNRECDNDLTPTETIIMTKLAPEIGVTFGDDRHMLMGGAVWLQPIGNGWDDYHIAPTLYYRYRGRKWSGSLGMFPRRQLQEKLPDFLWSDSLTYCQNNIRGGLLQFHNGHGFFDIYLDWRQLQTEKKREAFNIAFHGKWYPKSSTFFIGGHLLMNHFALTKHSSADEHIVDNFLINPYVGIDLSEKIPLDSLMVRGGPVVTVERNRADRGWEIPVGGWLEINAGYKRFYLKNTLYAGGIQMPSYAAFGSTLYQGNPFYSKKFYDRAEVGFQIIHNDWVNVDASLDFNFYSHGFIFYQKVIAEVEIGKLVSKKREIGKSRSSEIKDVE